MFLNSNFSQELLKRLERIDPEALKKNIQGLVEANQLYTRLCNELAEGLVCINREGTILGLNARASLWLGLDQQDRRKKIKLSDIEDEHLRNFLKEEIKDPVPSKHVKEFHVLTPREAHLRLHFVPLEINGEAASGIILEDRSALQNDAHDRERLERVEALMTLTAGIAHEIGNPLNSLSIHLQLLQKEAGSISGKVKDKVQERIRVIDSEVKRLDQIIKDFLNATRRQVLRFNAAQLNQTAEHAVRMMEPLADENRVKIKLKTDKKLSAFLFDRERMTQVCINLIKNAIEAMPGGGILEVEISHKAKVAAIRFSDEGSGIRAEDLPHIFDPFYTTKEHGSGLGLMTVYQTVHDHGGKIDVTSDNSGTSFVIYIPMRQDKLQLPQGGSTRNDAEKR